MKQFEIDIVIKEMESALDNVVEASTLKSIALCFKIAKSALKRLNVLMDMDGFKNNKEEIEFFKYSKPKILREVIYYEELYYLESLKPLADSDAVKHYYLNAVKINDKYFERYRFLYNYYNTGQTHMDPHYFIKSLDANSELIATVGSMDNKHCTNACYIISRFHALESIQHYVQKEIERLQGPRTDLQRSLAWTDSKVALIELLYALHLRGCFNGGNITLKTVVEKMSYMLQIDLSNFYVAFNQNIRIRKKNRAYFLQLLKNKFEEHMDETDVSRSSAELS